MTTKIVTRHPGAIRWLQAKGYEGEIVSHLNPDEDVERGDTVIGVLPIPLVKALLDKGAEFILLSLPKIALLERGNELTPEEMDAAGAALHRIRKIEMEEVA